MTAAKLSSWTEHPELVDFYSAHRNAPEALYASERRFLPWLARQAQSVLDVGCAAGGFSNIWRHYGRDLAYTGVDVSAPLIEVARRAYPDLRFLQGDCIDGLPLPDRAATVVAMLGVLVWIPQYREAMRELWRLTDRYLFLDHRLVARPEDASVGAQQLALTGRPWDGETVTPYVCIPWREFAEFLLGLEPAAILGTGYWGKPARTAMGVASDICFATFVLEKKSAASSHRQQCTVCVDLPWAWPADLTSNVKLLPGSELEDLVPSETA